MAAHVAKEQLKRVAGHDGQLVDGVAGAGLALAPAVVGHVDPAGLEPVGERLSLVVGELLRELGQVREIHAPLLLAAEDEGLDGRGRHGLSTLTSAPRSPCESAGTIPSSSHMTKKASAYADPRVRCRSEGQSICSRT